MAYTHSHMQAQAKVVDDMQVQGKDRLAVAEAGRRLGLDGTYIARSYIEQVTATVCTSLCSAAVAFWDEYNT